MIRVEESLEYLYFRHSVEEISLTLVKRKKNISRLREPRDNYRYSEIGGAVNISNEYPNSMSNK